MRNGFNLCNSVKSETKKYLRINYRLMYLTYNAAYYKFQIKNRTILNFKF